MLISWIRRIDWYAMLTIGLLVLSAGTWLWLLLVLPTQPNAVHLNLWTRLFCGGVVLAFGGAIAMMATQDMHSLEFYQKLRKTSLWFVGSGFTSIAFGIGVHNLFPSGFPS